MPHPVCLTNRISVVPRSCSEMMMLRRASWALAPAYMYEKEVGAGTGGFLGGLFWV